MSGWTWEDVDRRNREIFGVPQPAEPEAVLDEPLKAEALIELECCKLLAEDGWRVLKTDPVSCRTPLGGAFLLRYAAQKYKYRPEWMQRGNDLEQSAVHAYEFQTGNATDKVGFVTDDDGNLGCSPDRLIGEHGLLEIKVPSPPTHVGYMLTSSIEQDYTPQLQGQLLLTARRWVDIVSYCPPFPLVIIRVTRDGPYQTLLAEALDQFVQNLLAARDKLVEKYGDVRPPAVVEVPFDPLGVSEQDLKDMGIF